MKARVDASLAIRPVESFDAVAGGECSFHTHDLVTHVASVIVHGHAVAVMGICDVCAPLMRDGTDWLGKPVRAGDRVLG